MDTTQIERLNRVLDLAKARNDQVAVINTEQNIIKEIKRQTGQK